jgi:rubrerythrin
VNEENGQQEDVQVLREILARELETINNYQNLLSRSIGPEIATFINHIIDEEKEHVAESMTLINRIDERQAIRFTNSEHWRVSDESAPAPENRATDDIQHQKEVPRSALTVGSLRGNKSI